MPLKLKYVDGSLEVVENDRGDWKPACVPLQREFIGFHGENTIHVLMMSMQSGIHDVVVAHAAVDSYIRVAHGSSSNLEVLVNALIEEVYSCDGG